LYLIDTNIFLELQLDQSYADDCETFLREVSQGRKKAFVTDLILDGVLIVMESRGKKPRDLATFLASISSYRGIGYYWLSMADRLMATRLMNRYHLDYEDATTLQAARRLKVENIVSFDKDFDPIPSIKRLEPSQVIEKR